MKPLILAGFSLAGLGLLLMLLAFAHAVGWGALVGQPAAIGAAPNIGMTVLGFFSTVAGVVLLFVGVRGR